jgi:Tfp pilus assembly protein PilZ
MTPGATKIPHQVKLLPRRDSPGGGRRISTISPQSPIAICARLGYHEGIAQINSSCLEPSMVRPNTRRFPRYEVQDVEGTFLYNLQADVLNLSVGGMAVEARKRLDVGRSYMFTIRKLQDTIRLPGRVAWCVLCRTERVSDIEVVPIYHAGIHFEEVLTNRASQLVRLIEESALLDVKRRIFGRFKPGSGTSVTIDSEVDFAVQKISLGGMLIETTLRPEINDIYPMEVLLKDGRINVKGRVAYVGSPIRSDADEAPAIHLGVEFIDLEDNGRGLLEKFITEIIEAEVPRQDESGPAN